MSPSGTIRATAPGKVILSGEHSINRGQSALSTGIGLYVRCRVSPRKGGEFYFRSGKEFQAVSRETITWMDRQVASYQAREDYNSIRRLASQDYFAPAKYVLAAAFENSLRGSLDIEWESEIAPSCGLGSGGAAFTAMVAAIAPFLSKQPTLEQRAAWAVRGDIIAHGGTASALDTQTALFGGVIQFAGEGLAEPISYAPGFSLVVGNTGVTAATSEVNGRVRRWLGENPRARMTVFQAIGSLTSAMVPLLEMGKWEELGRLFTINQVLLEKIGVSCPELETLIETALSAGAFGAKLSGSGGGGIMIALVSPERRQAVADAITRAGGEALTAEIGVPGVRVENNSVREGVL